MAGCTAFHAFQMSFAGSMPCVWELLDWPQNSIGAEHYGYMETSLTSRIPATDCMVHLLLQGHGCCLCMYMFMYAEW